MPDNIKISFAFQSKKKKRKPWTKNTGNKRVRARKETSKQPDFFVMGVEGNLALCGYSNCNSDFSPRKEHDKNLKTLLSFVSGKQLIKDEEIEYYYPKEMLI